MAKQLGNARNDSRQPRLPKDPAKREKEMAIREWAKNNGVSIAVAKEYFREEKEEDQPYAYEWNTPEDIIANRNTKRKFGGWGDYNTLNKIADNPTEQECEFAHALWLKLKAAFNKEARHYDPETNMSRLGSIGEKSDREVMRSAWWDKLDGDRYGDYDRLTRIIEALHGGEQLETGRITFGS